LIYATKIVIILALMEEEPMDSAKDKGA